MPAHRAENAERRRSVDIHLEMFEKMNRVPKMIILTKKTEPSSVTFLILLLVSISTVFGCGVIRGGQSNE
ncbi:hypothetical protein KIN20_007188 [Parelaphostrongylus tenuis]|uniref:Uncharacterized protein n=1 Tax=Parelaphostrongylus tenuis TaxID=148309 RepID=A0AAD5M525_PARTN|nr:hypothetical protein KIN20_007188 [Parelaphostrongylus tenuis]